MAGLKQRKLGARVVGVRPLVDHEFAQRLNSAVVEADPLSGRLVIFTLERDAMSHFSPLDDVLRRVGGDRCMVVRIVSAPREFFEKALNLGPDELNARNAAALLTRLTRARTVRIRTRGGTDPHRCRFRGAPARNRPPTNGDAMVTHPLRPEPRPVAGAVHAAHVLARMTYGLARPMGAGGDGAAGGLGVA
ncbi:hypothetical protein [Streptomyces sp. NK08204]|uniref:hypothetical protein n=1 Tax=Streptomyces sp. NK08204 TaxID=2873260 RepID=UPI001CEC1C3F|nr:hypothetical protein [Streptomyces sp. NK08204]